MRKKATIYTAPILGNSVVTIILTTVEGECDGILEFAVVYLDEFTRLVWDTWLINSGFLLFPCQKFAGR